MSKYNRQITMKDVARRAGVSVTTVSHALNGTRFVEQTTKENVLKIVKELGYKPNILAQSLKGKGSKTIGIIISDIRENFFSEIVKAVEKIASHGGYNIMLCDSEDDPEKEDLYINILLQKGIDGLIYSPVDQDKEVTWLLDSEIPCVQIDRKTNNSVGDFLGIANFESAKRATEILIGNGCKKIGCIGYGKEVYTMTRRYQGYLGAIEENGMESNYYKTVHRGESILELGEWLKKNGIDGALCTNENLSYVTYMAAIENGKTIPEEFKIIGYDDARWLNVLKDPLTVIRQPTEKIGVEAVKTLIDRIEKKERKDFRTTIFPCEIIIRKSCGSKKNETIIISGGGEDDI